ncbi:MAG: MBOAT family protein [Mogibacterium sp.]|nr:MBOAT family protein [Mogibacterium sp.]
MIFTIILFIVLSVIYKYLPAMKIIAKDEQPVTVPLFTAMLVPMGIAFFVLSAISYILDIYTDKAEPGSVTDVFFYSMMFPKAACGPVALWRDFKPQIRERKTDLKRVSDGLSRIIIGYSKKAIIADTFASQIALIDAKVGANTTDSLTIWLLGLLYFFRIYYDFSGYSDIAIGLCSVFGFDIGENFNTPYLSTSLTDFWRGWHISLGRWFREYIYIPLGGNRSGNLYFNIFITFMIASAWHGWKLNLLLWGALNALVVIAEKAMSRKDRETRMPVWLRTALTMLLVYFGWMLFRAADMTSAAAIFKALFVPVGDATPNFTWQFFLTKRIAVFLIIAAAGSFGLLRQLGKKLMDRMGSSKYDIAEKTLLLFLFAVSIMFVLSNSYTPFIYSLIP